jgi:hypothetical protein
LQSPASSSWWVLWALSDSCFAVAHATAISRETDFREQRRPTIIHHSITTELPSLAGMLSTVIEPGQAQGR